MDYTVGTTIYKLFTTRAFATGIPTVLSGVPVVSAYENDSITQITAGITLGVDHDGVVGLNLLTIVATTGNGYEAGKEYGLVITTGTVGGVSVVGEKVAEFSLGIIADSVWDEILTGGTHNIATSAGRRLRGIQEFQGYEGGAVWIDTVNGTAGTTDYENGTVELPVDSIADANTLATSLGISRFEIAPGSTVTLAATQTAQLFQGHGWTLALGGQNVDETHFFSAGVSGVGTAATEMEFHDCEIGTASLQNSHCYLCSFDATVTHTLAGNYNYVNCYSEVAGAGAPTFTKTAGQTITAQWRGWSGGITVSGLQSGDVLTISGELGTVTLNGADATVEIRGTYKALVNNLTGSPTVNVDGAILAADVASILLDTAEIGAAGAGLTALATAVNLATVDTVVDSNATAIAALNDYDPTAQITESYAANGVAPTRDECMMAIHQMLMQFGIASTALTVRKLDNTTSAFVVTLDDDTAPTDAGRV